MTIIDKIKDPSPFFVRKPHPTVFKTSLDKQKYWANQRRIWVEGYDQDINGMLYFYAQEVILKDRVRGLTYYPTVRDADILIFNHIKKATDNGKAIFWTKARGIGASAIGMNLPFYFARVYPNSKCIATSKDKKTLASLFTEKTVIAYEGMDENIKPDLINKNQTANESYLKTGYRYINENGEEKYSENEFLCRDTQESDKAATNFSGVGAIYGFADEAPLMPRLMTFFPSARECFIDHSTNRMIGTLIMAGTTEATISQEGVKQIADIWNNAAILQIDPLFTPATYGKHMVNGHSNHEKARAEILQRRDELARLEDKSQLNAYIKNNPLSIEEIFEFGSGGLFDEDTIEKVNAQLRYLPKEKDLPTPHKIQITGTVAEAIPVSESPLLILEQPKENVDYIIGVDAVGTSDLTSSASGNSKYAAVVMKGVDPQSELQFAPIALYMERPRTIQHANIQAMNLLKHYNQFGKCLIMGELNQGAENLLQLIIDNGLSKCVMMRKDLSKKGWVDKNKPFFYRAEAILKWQIEAANTYFKKYSNMVRFKDLLIDATKGADDNTDALDALMAALYGWGSGDILGTPMKKRDVRKIKLLKYEMVNGVMQPVWYDKEVRV